MGSHKKQLSSDSNKDRKKKHKKASDSSPDSHELKKQRKKEKKQLKRLRKEQKAKEKKEQLKKDEAKSKSSDIPLHLMEKSKSMAPMTKEEWDKRQSVIKRVYDETTGRHRSVIFSPIKKK